MNNELDQLSQTMKEMRRMTDEMREQVNQMSQAFAWSDWEPFVVGVIPRRVNGRWYFKGDTIYRKEKMKYLTGSREYCYGDDFDILKDSHE
jgi:hypothetical protein